jgi:hypothetical protein
MRKENEQPLILKLKTLTLRSEDFKIIIGKDRKIMRGFNRPYFGKVHIDDVFYMDIRNLTNEMAKWAGFKGTADYFAQEYNKDKGFVRKVICMSNFRLNPSYPLEV